MTQDSCKTIWPNVTPESIHGASREEIHNALKKVKALTFYSKYICVRSQHLNYQEEITERVHDAVRALIEERIGKYSTLCQWAANETSLGRDVWVIEEEYRELWLNMLINEHSSDEMYLLARFRDFLIAYAKWDEVGQVTEDFNSWRIGLCFNFTYKWLSDHPESFYTWMSLVMFKDFPNRTNPFNSHEERMAWVNQKILELNDMFIKEPK